MQKAHRGAMRSVVCVAGLFPPEYFKFEEVGNANAAKANGDHVSMTVGEGCVQYQCEAGDVESYPECLHSELYRSGFYILGVYNLYLLFAFDLCKAAKHVAEIVVAVLFEQRCCNHGAVTTGTMNV